MRGCLLILLAFALSAGGVFLGLLSATSTAKASGKSGVPDNRSVLESSNVGVRTVQIRSGNEGGLTPDGRVIESAARDVVYVGITGFRKFDLAINDIKAALSSGRRVSFLLMDCRSQIWTQLEERESNRIASEFESGMNKALKFGLFDFPQFSVRLRKDRLPSYSGFFVDSEATNPVGSAVPVDAFIRMQPRTQFGSEHTGFVFELIRTEYNRTVFDNYIEDVRKDWSEAKPYDPKHDSWECPKSRKDGGAGTPAPSR